MFKPFTNPNILSTHAPALRSPLGRLQTGSERMWGRNGTVPLSLVSIWVGPLARPRSEARRKALSIHVLLLVLPVHFRSRLTAEPAGTALASEKHSRRTGLSHGWNVLQTRQHKGLGGESRVPVFVVFAPSLSSVSCPAYGHHTRDCFGCRWCIPPYSASLTTFLREFSRSLFPPLSFLCSVVRDA